MKTGEKGRRGRRKKVKVENVGRYVKKQFDGYGVFLGKVVSFADGLYRVDYEDGDFEDLETNEVEELIVDESGFDQDYRARMKKLDALIKKKGGEGDGSIGNDEVMVDTRGSGENEASLVGGLSNADVPEVGIHEKMDIEVEDLAKPVDVDEKMEDVDEKMEDVEKPVDGHIEKPNDEDVEKPVDGDIEKPNDEDVEEPVDGDVDSSSDSCEFGEVRNLATEDEVPLIPPPELPASSGNIGVPEESVSYLFSVYSFLRSFSIQLYLCPFKLDDFVGSLNCHEPNTLLSDVHFTLLRVLRRHLESISSEGTNHAAKCLRRLDWSLLDTLTWPIYLVEYLVTMVSLKGPEWKGFPIDVLTVEYHSVSVAKKLMILQILCDDVMESAELRAELDLREKLVEGSDINGTAKSDPPLNGPTRVHPKYSKTSASKDLESRQAKSSNSKSNHEPKIPEQDTDTTDVDQDENSDECKLCGMDGTLLCCDGCPSAYHSRCIGLNKMLIPDGLWYCPECTANKVEPALKITSELNGAEILGVDPYEQIFMGFFNHLLVFNVSIGAGSSSRYYKKTDIPKVIQVLFSTEQHKNVYSGICKSIMQYWEISESLVSSLLAYTKEDPKTSVSDSNFSLPGRTETEKYAATDTKGDSKISDPIYTPDEKRNAFEGENCVSSALASIKNEMLSGPETESQQVQLQATSLETVNQEKVLVLQRDDGTGGTKLLPSTDTQSCEKLGTESLVSSVSNNHCPDHSDLTQHSCAKRATGLGFGNYPQGSNGDIGKKVVDGLLLPRKDDTPITSFVKVEGKINGDGGNGEDESSDSLYLGSLFKPQSYINQYFQGDIAAAAAANLAVLASEGKGVTETNSSANYRKMVSANIALQLKAFSSVSICFIWPNSEKKVMEVPRERCGWCFACKAPTTSKRGCLLNLAASNAIKGSARGLRPIKNGEGSIPKIAAYILYIADSLRGLLVGPFLSSSYRKQWRKDVEEASSCSALKFSLLELEEYIRPVAFSVDWVKLVDDWMVESSAAQNTTSLGAPPKRPGRRGRKPAAIAEVAADLSLDKLKIVNWWRGGKLSKLVFQRSLLPCSLVKMAARQGGRKRIPGIYYTESSENPKRSRRFAWRVAVEMSKNAPQLALQVRYLDLYLRWSDMVRSDQNSHESKGMEAETLAYRNAQICDKRTNGNNIRYGLIFNQKHLPSRIMKSIIEVEKNENGEEIFWFSEIHVPLFLIKDFEQKIEKDTAPPSKPLLVLSKLQKKQLKAFRRDIFTYLMHKEEKVDKCPCASCQEDLLLGDAVKCNDCEGYCHKHCAPHSTISMEDEGDYAVLCNRCLTKTLSLNESMYKTPGSHSVPQIQEYKQVGVFTKESLVTNGNCQPLVSNGNSEPQSLIKSAVSGRSLTSKSKRGGVLASYGVIWKQKNNKETGTNFRLSHILLRCNGDINPSQMPDCYLCAKPYNPNLMYICCEECQLWYHADAVQLKESQIFDVIGFKCCKCRRKTSPICPYGDVERRRHPDSKRLRARAAKQQNSVIGAEHETISSRLMASEMSTEWDEEMEEMIVKDDDPLLFSLERVEPISESVSDFSTAWDTAGASVPPQKLPIRRQPKPGNTAPNQKLATRGEFNGGAKAETSDYFGGNSLNMEFETQFNFSGNASPPQAEWEFPVNDFKDEEMFDYENMNFEDMEFEPQTYFSYTELLDTDDIQSSLCDPSANSTGDLVNSSTCVAPPSNVSEQQNVDATNVRATVKAAPCRMCIQTEPAPDLVCEVCEMQMHGKCSPWEEYTSSGGWKCGNCREWV